MSEPYWAPLGKAIPPPTAYGTSLPASPIDGQKAILVDLVTDPTFQWQFQYNAQSTSPFKWEFIGGSPKLTAYFGAAGFVEITPANTWVTIPSSVQMPRDGDYFCQGRCSFNRWTGTGTDNIYLGVGGGTISSIVRIIAGYTSDAYGQMKVLGQTAFNNLSLYGYANTTTGVQVWDGALAMWPIRVS